MDTIVKKMDRDNLKKEDFAEAVEILRKGGLVAFPTETVYGLGGDALDETAAARIYAAKGRPSDNPLIVHIADTKALYELASEVPESALVLAEKFWPGPLTMILKKRDTVPAGTTGGLDTVAIRMPSDEVARMLIQESGCYIAAPSANASGRPSTTKAEHVYEDLNGKIEMILDGGAVTIGLESTIVDLSGEIPMILRPGYISLEDLKPYLPGIIYDKAVIAKQPEKNVVAKAPGMKYRHYAPKGELTIVEGDSRDVIQKINEEVAVQKANGKKVAVLATEETKGFYDSDRIKVVGSRNAEETIAAHLFECLREFDAEGVTCIYSESFEAGNLGQAIMNRLLKAAGYRVISAKEK